MTPTYSSPPVGGSLSQKASQEPPYTIKGESPVRPLTSVLLDLGAFDGVIRLFGEQSKAIIDASHTVAVGIKEVEGLVAKVHDKILSASNIEKLGDEIAHLKRQLGAKEEEISSLRREIATLRPEPAGVIHPSVYRIFNTTPESINADSNKIYWPAVRAWSTFVEWSESLDAKCDQFTTEFRKFDVVLMKLKNDNQLLNLLRDRVAKEIATTVSRNIFARITVSWSFTGKTIDIAKNYSSGGGQRIIFVKSAMISRDGLVLDKAEVECE